MSNLINLLLTTAAADHSVLYGPVLELVELDEHYCSTDEADCYTAHLRASLDEGTPFEYPACVCSSGFRYNVGHIRWTFLDMNEEGDEVRSSAVLDLAIPLGACYRTHAEAESYVKHACLGQDEFGRQRMLFGYYSDSDCKEVVSEATIIRNKLHNCADPDNNDPCPAGHTEGTITIGWPEEACATRRQELPFQDIISMLVNKRSLV